MSNGRPRARFSRYVTRAIAAGSGAAAILVLGTGSVQAITITEFPSHVPSRDADGTATVTAGPNGTLWFTMPGNGRIGRLSSTTGRVTQFSHGLTAKSFPWGITTGPEGDLWFTELGAAKIGRITPAGVITQFPDGTTSSRPSSEITAGPEGNLWFTYGCFFKHRQCVSNLDTVGRITTNGVVTEFSGGGSALSAPGHITDGPDGNLWFDEGIGLGREGVEGYICRLTPAGVVSRFPAHTVNSQPGVITVGPDGNLWYTIEGGRGGIGRITPTGTVTLLADGIQALAIAPGPDGNLWFTEVKEGRAGTSMSLHGRIGRITPAGVVTHFPEVAGTRPRDIIQGPEGALWFSDFTGIENQIGRVSVTSAGETPGTNAHQSRMN